MNATSFTYDGVSLASLNYMICQFETESGFQTSTAGSNLTFTKVKQFNNGSKYYLSGSKYDTCFETTFSFCHPHGETIIPNDYAEVMRWLNRTEFKKFSLDNNDWGNIYFYGTFNVQKVEHRGRIVGFTVTFTTNAPFAFGTEKEYNFTISSAGESYTIRDASDEIGITYPTSLIITTLSNGDLQITNSVEDRLTSFHNMSTGETLMIDNTLSFVQTSDSSHAILDDFNYNFLRIANTFTDKDNVLTFTLPCTVSLKYTPIKKVVF